MAFSRPLGVIGILGACFCVAVGCDDDGDKTVKARYAGEDDDDVVGGDGKAGSDGKSTGGSNNNSGNGGTATAGSANDAGAGGEPLGGGGGTAPIGGMADEGGTVTGGGAGAGGDGGDAGEGGGAPVTAKSCGDQCEVSDDCIVADLFGVQKICDAETKRCVERFGDCEINDDCVPFASSFLKTCVTQTDCDDVLAVCVNWNGSGYCASQPMEGTGCVGQPGTIASELPEFGNADPSSVAVCINLDGGRCASGECMIGCEASLECDGETNGTCNETSGFCECETSSECDGKACQADHRCADCVTEADCDTAKTGLDACVDGKCGCSAADSCLDQTVSATPVCE